MRRKEKKGEERRRRRRKRRRRGRGAEGGGREDIPLNIRQSLHIDSHPFLSLLPLSLLLLPFSLPLPSLGPSNQLHGFFVGLDPRGHFIQI
jgi:hypothetical protein